MSVSKSIHTGELLYSGNEIVILIESVKAAIFCEVCAEFQSWFKHIHIAMFRCFLKCCFPTAVFFCVFVYCVI